MFELLSETVSNERVTDDTWLIALRSRKIAQAAKPGQFVMIRVSLGLDPLLRRPFSICGVKEDLFLVLYRVVGKGTSLMRELRQGERLQVLGPLGQGFAVPKKVQPASGWRRDRHCPPPVSQPSSQGEGSRFDDGVSFGQGHPLPAEDHG